MQYYSAAQFRQRLAGLESPETQFGADEMSAFKSQGVELILALREVFGSTLDRKTIWERISNGLKVASAKSSGKGETFLAEMLDYVKAEANGVVGNEKLISLTAFLIRLSPEAQRQFIRVCVEYRMLLCLQARAIAQSEKSAADEPHTALDEQETPSDYMVEVPIDG